MESLMQSVYWTAGMSACRSHLTIRGEPQQWKLTKSIHGRKEVSRLFLSCFLLDSSPTSLVRFAYFQISITKGLGKLSNCIKNVAPATTTHTATLGTQQNSRPHAVWAHNSSKILTVYRGYLNSSIPPCTQV